MTDLQRLQLQYLHREMLLRMAIQNLILILLMILLVASVMMAAALPAQGGLLALAYVVAAGMGALYWIHNSARYVQMKAYLQTIETQDPDGTGWELWLAANPIAGPLGSRWFISTKGVFVGSQVAAVVLCGVLAGPGGRDPVPLTLALLGIAATVPLLRHPRL